MPWSKDGWEATPFLRFRIETIKGYGFTKPEYKRILQQLWVETDIHYFDSNRLSEWRDVPVAEDE